MFFNFLEVPHMLVIISIENFAKKQQIMDFYFKCFLDMPDFFLMFFSFLQNNNLTGQVPNSLTGKPGLNLK